MVTQENYQMKSLLYAVAILLLLISCTSDPGVINV